MAGDWPFPDPEDLAVFSLARIIRGEAPVLLVTHDEDDGGWQFLDDGEVTHADATLVALGEIARGDPSLMALGDLPAGWIAWREGPTSPWRRAPAEDDEVERKVRDDVEAFGWHVVRVPDDDEGPGFAYSIGLTRTLDHPEVILFGLDGEMMHRMINAIGEAVRAGSRFAPGDALSGIIEGFDIRFGRVDPGQYRDYLGHAIRYHGGGDFSALQAIWPDRRGVYPGDPAFPEAIRGLQPRLDLPPA